MSIRVNRLAMSLLSLQRQSAVFDPETKKRYTYTNRNQLLTRYLGRKDIFASFTELPKLGINPQSDYNTPMGVYAYPLDYMYTLFKGGKFKVPFAGNQKYIHIFRFSNIANCLVFEDGARTLMKEYREKSYSYQRSDQEKQEDKEIRVVLERIQELSDSLEKSPVLRVYDFSYKEGIQESYNEWYSKWFEVIQRDSGLMQLKDPGLIEVVMKYGDLTKEKAWHVSIDGVDDSYVMSSVRNYQSKRDLTADIFPLEQQLSSLHEVRQMSKMEYISLKSFVLESSLKCDQAFIYKFLDQVADSNPRKWTGLMRRVGILGAIDYGTSTIHPGEPTQAVFFDPTSIKVLEVLPNVNTTKNFYPDSGSLSDWSGSNEKDIQEVLQKIRETVAYLERSINDKSFWGINHEKIKTISMLVGWLNTHAQNSPYWNSEFKEPLIDSLSEIRFLAIEHSRDNNLLKSEQSSYDRLSRYLDLIIKVLRRKS